MEGIGRLASCNWLAARGLRKLLDRERFVFSPKAGTAGRWYEVSARPSLDRFLAAIEPLKKAVASPTGFEPVFQP